MLPFWTKLAKYSKDLSKVASASSGKQHPGNSLMLRWYAMHSQHMPFREQGS